MTVRYTVPGENFETEEVEFVFSYDAEATAATSSRISREGGGPTALLTTYESSADGFRIGVPSGWVVDDEDSLSSLKLELLTLYQS